MADGTYLVPTEYALGMKARVNLNLPGLATHRFQVTRSYTKKANHHTQTMQTLSLA